MTPNALRRLRPPAGTGPNTRSSHHRGRLLAAGPPVMRKGGPRFVDTRRLNSLGTAPNRTRTSDSRDNPNCARNRVRCEDGTSRRMRTQPRAPRGRYVTRRERKWTPHFLPSALRTAHRRSDGSRHGSGRRLARRNRFARDVRGNVSRCPSFTFDWSLIVAHTPSHPARHPRQLEQLEDRLVPALNLTGVEWRTIDGHGQQQVVRNPAPDDQGAAETQQIRFGYGDRFLDDPGDVIITEATTPSRENPRTISNAIHDQNGSIPSERNLTDWVFQWGQWITHDMDLTRTGPQFNVLSNGVVGRLPHPDRRPERPAVQPRQPVHPVQPVGVRPRDRRRRPFAARWSTASRRTSTRRWCTAPTTPAPRRCGRPAAS